MNAKDVRQLQRDKYSLLIGAMMVLIDKIFEINDSDVTTALTTIVTVMVHRSHRGI